MTIIITGAAGFIGFHVSKAALTKNINVIGIDNLNDYYDPTLKNNRLSILKKIKNFTFYKGTIEDKKFLKKIFQDHKIDFVINLAAYAGVRHSLIHPQDYIDANITGFLNILELSKIFNVKHLIYASSSSVYGLNSKIPFSEKHFSEHPVSLYGATKKANELMAHTYSHLFELPTTGLRFFTVYGPWGRPDMALYIFTKSIIEDKPIEVFNNGNHRRDFTYIDDIVESIIRLIDLPPVKNVNFNTYDPDPSLSSAPFQILNIGNSETIELNYFIEIIERNVGKKAKKKFLDMQLGDVEASFSDTNQLNKITGFLPYTSIEEGIKNFVDWYHTYHNVRK